MNATERRLEKLVAVEIGCPSGRTVLRSGRTVCTIEEEGFFYVAQVGRTVSGEFRSDDPRFSQPFTR